MFHSIFTFAESVILVHFMDFRMIIPNPRSLYLKNTCLSSMSYPFSAKQQKIILMKFLLQFVIKS